MLKALQVDNKYNFYDPRKNIAFSFNETAWNIIKYINELGKEEAIKKLSELYEIDEKTIKKDIEDVLKEINSYSLSIDEFPKEITKIQYSPVVVELDITSKCNSDCIYCIASDRMNKEEIPKEKIFDIINQLNDLNTWSITLSGGEPTLRKDFFEILKYCNDLEMKTTIFTNGMNIDREIAEKISKFEYVNVQVSLDSCIPEHHDKHRGKKGCFEKALNGIKNLLEFGVPITIATVISPVNIDDIEDTAEFLHKLGIKEVRVGNVALLGKATDAEKKFSLNERQLKEIGTKIMKVNEKYDGEISFSKSPHMVSFTGDVNDFKKPLHNCNIGKYCLHISSNGYVYPCLFLAYPEFLLGDAKKEKISDIWNNSEKIKKLQRLSHKDIEKCSSCDYGFLCTGGCKGSAYQTFKNLNAPDPAYCSFFGVEISEDDKNKYSN